MSKKPRRDVTRGAQAGSNAPLVVWGDRRPDPDWDRYLAVLVALALREVEAAADEEGSGG